MTQELRSRPEVKVKETSNGVTSVELRASSSVQVRASQQVVDAIENEKELAQTLTREKNVKMRTEAEELQQEAERLGVVVEVSFHPPLLFPLL